ncbi:winged helix-turn-helix transcriptional regulator [Tianweitania sp. BSSL-BM11]|uniref:Winged helix-turn-helix transcriptional regulator n=1 Tax=Tianweitania aestuarii TaxID=2814886 RepID=A0ABS5RV46_9HYPH|nr:winged helix-turn-helix domain-containing protein [Tianweitania aestuarii]MBS9720197.1 winged helix-turn-helix transcriptional regulator [Tianweitania aestuarii]
MSGLQTRLVIKDVERLNRAQLIDYVGELEGQIEALRIANADERTFDRLQRAFDLSPFQARTLAVLADGKQRTKNAILNGVYWDQSVDHWPEPKIIDVYVCKLRKKLDGSGIGIVTAWGAGYRLDGVEELARIIAGAKPKTGCPAMLPRRRMVGDKATPYVTLRDAAIAWFCERAKKGRATFTMSEMVTALSVFNTSCSTVIRNLERYGDIRVHRVPKPGKAGNWIVEVLRQPEQVAA